ncbi:MAG: chemotaxis protein CheW [Deltaproteobacteria bacterium]|nr:chemotaxis protein CheW [Deltaproteobacteria bacterium]
MEDGLLFEVEGKRLCLELKSVECVVEREKVFFVPGKRPPVEGIITHRGEMVAVVSLERIYGTGETGEARGTSGGNDEGPCTIVIAREGARALGLSVKRKRVSFLWKEDFENMRFRAQPGRFSKGSIEFGGILAEAIDCLAIYNEVSSILSQNS